MAGQGKPRSSTTSSGGGEVSLPTSELEVEIQPALNNDMLKYRAFRPRCVVTLSATTFFSIILYIRPLDLHRSSVFLSYLRSAYLIHFLPPLPKLTKDIVTTRLTSRLDFRHDTLRCIVIVGV